MELSRYTVYRTKWESYLITVPKQGDPPIWTRVKDWEDFITIHVFGLNEGEEKIVGQRIADLFKR